MSSFKFKTGLVVYVTCGDPNIATSREVIIAAIDAGADVIELGVPFSDPVADGPIIQRASERALAGGTTLSDVLDLAKEVRAARPQSQLILFSYLNPILRIGLTDFTKQVKVAGIDGVLITDLTLEEADHYRDLMSASDLATIFLCAPTSPDSRIKKIAHASQGFIYAVSRTGVTGSKLKTDTRGDAKHLVKRIRKVSKLPIAVGFGISSARDFAEVRRYADAAVIGSTIVHIIESESAKGSSRKQVAAAVADWIGSLTRIPK